MSGLASSNARSSVLDVRAKGLGVLDALGYVPDAMVGALRVRILDLVAHHRSTVGKKVAQDFRNRRGAQKLWFAQSFQFTNNKALALGDLGGGSFALGLDHGRESIWSILQTGGRVKASGLMLIPFPNLTAKGKESWDNFTREYGQGGHIDASRFTITPQGDVYEKRIGGDRSRGAAVMIGANGGPIGPGGVRFLGVARMSRTSGKRLKFWESFDEVLAKHSGELDKVFELAVTAAGRQTLDEQTPVKLEALKSRLAGKGRVYTGSKAGGARQQAAAEAAKTKLNPMISITPGRGGGAA